MKVSVTIPCRNEERYIERCVRSVLSSDYTGGIKVLVCDGKSEDKTQELVRSLSKADPRVELIINEKQTTPFALNLGIKNAPDCDVHIILGAHAEVAVDYIRKCVEHLQRDESIGCVGGVLDNVNEDHNSEVIAKAMSSPFGVGSAHFRTGAKSGFVDTVAFGAYRKEVFEKAGCFDEDLTRNQDDEFNYRVIKSGFRIYLDPTIRARYYVRASFKKLRRQYYQYGLWKVYVNKKHGAVTSLRQLAPPVFVLFMICTPLAILSYFTIGLWLLIWVLYFVAAIIATINTKATLSESGAVLISFFYLHFSYGIGYLTGIWRFIIVGEKPGVKHSTTSR